MFEIQKVMNYYYLLGLSDWMKFKDIFLKTIDLFCYNS